MSNYNIGTGKEDISFYEPGLVLLGFMEKEQKTDGKPGIPPQQSRAFIIHDPSTDKRVVIVIAEIWSCTQFLKTEVMKKLQEMPELANHYKAENIQLSGTHTHSGAGGFSEYGIYNDNLTGPMRTNGLILDNVNTIVKGIVNSILEAHQNLGPGKILVYTGDKNILTDCGGNRSALAYANNTNPTLPNTDQEMLLLKFIKNEEGPIGIINWFPIHPNSQGQTNLTVSGDNKGWAAMRFEEEMKSKNNFVAAFANANCGDVSGNVFINPKTRDFASDLERMKKYGNLQFEKALELFNEADENFEELKGPIAYCYNPDQDMTDIRISENKRTWKPAVGISTLAGSTTDGINYRLPKLKEGTVKGHLSIYETTIRLTVGSVFGVHFFFRSFGNPEISFTEYMELEAEEKIEILKNHIKDEHNLEEITVEHENEIRAAHEHTSAWFESLERNSNSTDENELYTDDELSTGLQDGHAEKPIVIWALRKHSYILPFSVPLQILRIGNFVSLGIPGELTTMAGRKLRVAILEELKEIGNTSINHLALSTYSNGYSQYITTREEYAVQRYEGSSTLFGPHTLEAYIMLFKELAKELSTPS